MSDNTEGPYQVSAGWYHRTRSTPIDQTKEFIIGEVLAGRLRPEPGHAHEPERWTHDGAPVDNPQWREAIRLLLTDKPRLHDLADLLDVNDEMEQP